MSAPHSRMPLMFWLRAKPASAALSGSARSSGSVVLPVCAALMVNLWAASADADFDARGRRAKKPSSGTTHPNPGATPPKPRATAPKPRAVPTTDAIPTTDAAEAQRSGDVLISRYTAALLQQPGDTFPLQRLAELYRERDGNLQTLIADFDAKLTSDATNLGLLLALAFFNEAEGRTDEALRLRTRATAIHPHNPAPLLAMANAHERDGNSQEVARLLEQALGLQKEPAEREQTLRKLRSLALDRKDIQAANGFQRELVAKASNSTFARSELGRELLGRGLFAEASAEFERVLRASAGDNRALAPVLLDLGQAQAGAQDTDAAITTLERALTLTPADSGLRRDVLTSLVNVHRNANRLPKFIAFLEKGRGQDFAEQVLLADLYVDSGRLDDGLAAYQSALRHNPRDVDTRLKLLRLLELRGELKAAVAEYRALIRVVPNQPQYVFQLSELLRKVGDRDAALRELDALCARAAADVETLATAVNYYEQIGESSKAQALLERVANVTSNPDHVIELGGRYFANGDETRAISTWKRVIELVTDKAQAHHLLGEVYLEHDLTLLALEALNQATELAPANPRFKRSLALALERTGASSARAVRLQRYAEAQRLWEALLTTADSPNQKREARQHITTLWSLQGSLKDRVAPLKRAFHSRPPHVPSGRMLAEVYQRLNQLDDAERVLRELTQLAPGDPTIWATLEQVLVNQHRLEAAIAVAERQVELEPKRAREHYQRLSRYAADLYKDEDAVRYAHKAVTMSPDDAEGYLRLGDMHRKREELQLAVQAYRKALSLNERLYQAYLSLAELLSIQNKADEADQLWRKLVRSAVDEELLQKAARASMQYHLSNHTEVELERDLLPLAIAYPQRPIYRTLLVELYAAWTAPLVTTLSTAQAEVARNQARAQLEDIGKRALKPLLDVLGDHAAHQHVTAIELLSQLQNPDANFPLLTFAQSEATPSLRERALIAIGMSEPKNVAPQLEALLFDGQRPRVDESSKISLAAVWAYCQIDSPEVTRHLHLLLHSDAPTASVVTLLTLARRHDSTLVDQLGPLLSSDNHSATQAAAAFAVGELLGEFPARSRRAELLTALANLADNGAPLARATALTALARLHHDAFPRAVSNALLSPDAALRANAARATSAYFSRFEPPPPYFATELRLEPETMLTRLLPPAPTAEQALRALDGLKDELVAQARATYAKSEMQSLAITDAFTRGSRMGFSPLTDGFENKSEETQKHAEDAAIAIARPLIDGFVELTTHPSTRVRASALRVLLQLDSPQAIEVVGALLTAPDGKNAALILALLAAHPRAGLTTSILPLLDPGRSWSLRREAVSTLMAAAADHAPTDRKLVLDKLAERLLEDDNAFVREELVKAYAAWAGEQSRALLSRVAQDDPEPSVRNRAKAIIEDLP